MFDYKIWSVAAVLVYLAFINVHADLAAIMTAKKTLADECTAQYGTTIEQIREAKLTRKFDEINPCFLSCFFKKSRFSSGKELHNNSTEKHATKSDEVLQKLQKVKTECADKVKDAKASDGDEGCEKALLVFKCFVELKHELGIDNE